MRTARTGLTPAIAPFASVLRDRAGEKGGQFPPFYAACRFSEYRQGVKKAQNRATSGAALSIFSKYLDCVAERDGFEASLCIYTADPENPLETAISAQIFVLQIMCKCTFGAAIGSLTVAHR